MKDDIVQLLADWPIGYMLKLSEESTCVVAGAYKGKVIELLHELYAPRRIVGFDPADWAISEAGARVGSLPGVELYHYGIGTQNGTFPMGEWGTDGCSFVNTDVREKGEGDMCEIGEVFRGLELDHIDCAIFNMEGYEWELLTHMRKRNMFRSIDILAVQFHPGVGGNDNYLKWLPWLELTHRRYIDHFPQWVVWKKRHSLDRILP